MTDHSQIPSYSSSGPSRRANYGVPNRYRLRVISAPTGLHCKTVRGTCEWYETTGGERKCGWHGDDLFLLDCTPGKCQDCLDHGAPRKSEVLAADRDLVLPWTTHDQTLLKRAARKFKTDTAAAKALGIPRSSLSRYLTGFRKPTENKAVRSLRKRVDLVLSATRTDPRDNL